MSTVSGSASNASPPAPRASNQQHTRTYQACIPCRRRKVRCDLGPVDAPFDPPCVRCRRESKECFFSATRRKRKTHDGSEEIEDVPDDYEVRNGRKRLKADDNTPPIVHRPEPIQISRPSSSTAYVPQPLTPGGSVGQLQPLRRPNQLNPQFEEEDRNASNQAASILQTREVFSGHDALNLLFEAAGRNGDIEGHHRANSASSLHRPTLGDLGSTPGSQTAFASPQGNQTHGLPFADGRHQSRSAVDPVDPAISQAQPELPEPPNEAAFAEAVKAWNKSRFVRAGWLTAKEAVAYIDYFYIHLSPLTPIVVPDYRDHASHSRLLREEPLLTVTLLTISSRFARPQGSGAASRYYLIHEMFWKHLQKMINRMIYGQEQFGGGFCGAGQQPGSDVNPLSRKGLRTLGTVESLMLLTEWHPRALHFPPGDNDDELVLPDDAIVNDNTSPNGINDPNDLYKGPGGQRIDSWLEPCWRSDRMCWMLLGNAVSLAFEIGVFDDTSESEFEQANQHLSHATVKAYFRRKNHLKDLLLIYVTQTSGRLGLTSMLPKVERADGDLSDSKTPNQLYNERIKKVQPPPPQIGMRSDGQRLPYESVATQNRHAVQDLVLDFWNRIAKLMESANLKLYPNRRQTRELLKSGNYEELLRHFQTPLHEWRRNFEQATQVPTQLKHVLSIEYEYTRVYLNSLALQAVVERCTHNTPQQTHAQPNGPSSSTSRDGGAIPFSTLVKWYGNDRHYIKEVIDASRNVLLTVVEGLYPGDYLRHAPVRTFFRIVSVAIILLKTFALGATEDDVAYSLNLLGRAVLALRTSIVDDVHVGNRFADLMESLTNRIRARFVRLSGNGGSTGISRAGSHSPTRAQTPMMPPPQPLNQSNHLGPPYGGTMGGYPQPSTSIPGSPSLGVSTSGRATPNPSLWGINTEAYDPNSNSISIMPPPSFGSNGYNTNFMDPQFSVNTPGSWGQSGMDSNQDWLALPLDPLLNQWGADITQTAMGPDVGGFDMLDVLLNYGGPPGSA